MWRTISAESSLQVRNANWIAADRRKKNVFPGKVWIIFREEIVRRRCNAAPMPKGPNVTSQSKTESKHRKVKGDYFTLFHTHTLSLSLLTFLVASVKRKNVILDFHIEACIVPTYIRKRVLQPFLSYGRFDPFWFKHLFAHCYLGHNDGIIHCTFFDLGSRPT